MTDGPSSEPGYSSASTAQVEAQQISQAMHKIEKGFRNRNSVITVLGAEAEAALIKNEYDPGFIPFDVTRHVLEYLPTPCVVENGNDSDEEDAAKKKSAAQDIEKSSEFLGIQGVGRSSSIKPTDTIEMDPEFSSMFETDELRLLALVSHNNMKQAMKQFVIANKNVLKKFRLTGTNTTMSMLREVFGDDPEVAYGPKCKSGPLGGDAQLVAMAVTGQLGGCIFFIDPMDAHPHSADIECLVRQGNVHNILMMNNPTTAHICLNSLRVALKMGRMEMMPSFFFDLESPSVEAYKMRQNQVLQSTIDAKTARPKSIIQSARNLIKAPRREEENMEAGSYEESRSSLVQSAKNLANRPTSIIKSNRREKLIMEAMERANKMSIVYRSTGKSVKFFDTEEMNASGSGDATENFLPVDGDKGKDVSDGKKKKKKKKKFFGVF